MQLKDDEVAATGHVGSQPLNVPKTFRGNAHIILPLVQAEPASSGPLDRWACPAEMVHNPTFPCIISQVRERMESTIAV